MIDYLLSRGTRPGADRAGIFIFVMYIKTQSLAASFIIARELKTFCFTWRFVIYFLYR